jgi:hypothetical protein
MALLLLVGVFLWTRVDVMARIPGTLSGVESLDAIDIGSPAR